VAGYSDWVVAPPDVPGAGRDEWASMTGIPPTHPLIGGPGWGPDSSGTQADAGFARVVDGAPGMPGGAPTDRHVRAGWDDWRDLFNPHSPMMWLLLFALAATSLVHFRLQGRVGPASAGARLG
jgi:hypothetical protein